MLMLRLLVQLWLKFLDDDGKDKAVRLLSAKIYFNFKVILILFIHNLN